MAEKKTCILALALMLLAACTPAQEAPSEGDMRLAAIECTPELQDRANDCTAEYEPVCADGTTYSNKCFACREQAVDRYFIGSCEDLGRDTPEPVQPGNAGENSPSVVDSADQSEYVECTEPRPEACTKEYMPVCGQRDNGIRCITEPCDNIDQVTYGNGCEACADQAVYGYVPGSCAEQPAPKRAANLHICDPQSPFNDPQTCVDACPAGYDEYPSQTGRMCIEHYGAEEILSWKACTSKSMCTSEEACVKTTMTTDNQPADEEYRCAPNTYFEFLLHTSGAEFLDENGEPGAVIA